MYELRLRLILCVLLPLATSSSARGRENGSPVSPAKAAKTIAPFIDEDTIAVAHVDVSRIDVNKLYAAAAPLLPAGHPLLRMHRAASQALESFLKAGGRDLYGIVSVADLPEPGPFVLVPLGKSSDEEALRALSGGAFVERIGDVLVIGRQAAREPLAAAAPVPRPELLRALEAVADSEAQVVFIPSAAARRVVEELMPTLPAEAGGGATAILTHGVLWAALGVDSSPEAALRLVVQSQSGDAASALQLFTAGRVRDHWPQNDKIAKTLLPDVKQDRLLVALGSDRIAQLGTALRPLVDLSTHSVRRSESTNQLKRIGLAMHTYADVFKHFPSAAIADIEGRPLLSWRVAILPYIDEMELYRQFHLNEPWDSEHNRKLIDRIPDVYRSFGSLAPHDRTSFVVATGVGTVFEGIHGTGFGDITDGTSNTLMVFEADDEHAVTWTRPEDFKLDPDHPSAGFTSPYPDGRLLLFCDGSVRFIRQQLEDETIRRLILRNDGKPLPTLR
ncbi:MAG: DUF1559 domain-containing protein [Pirellulales bacterium]